MSDTKLRIRKATALLREDHQSVKKLFSQYEDIKESDAGKKSEVFNQVKAELTVHATIEEELFYPAVEHLKKGQKIGEDLVKEAHEEHKIVKTLLEELSGLTPADDQFDAKMKVLQENVEHHVEEEQEEIFPLFDELDKDEQDRVSQELADRKQELSPE